MRSVRHSVALLALFASGCFLDHQHEPGSDGGRPVPIPDAARVEDAGVPPMCFDADGWVGTITCPGAIYAPGDYVEVSVWHSFGGCCGGGVGTLGVAVDEPGGWALRSRWEGICDCCDVCDCIGPSEETTITIGPLVAGENRVYDASGSGASCVLIAQEPEACEAVPAEPVAARVLFPDQAEDATLTHVAGADCGCAPRVRAPSPDVLELSLCGCTESCDDVITPYHGHHAGETRPPGEYSRVLGGQERPLLVADPDRCSPLEPTGLTVVTPDAGGHHVGPPLVWLGVDGEQGLCCAEPLPAVRSVRTADGAIEVSLFSCVQEDCFCLPDEPTPFTGWHSLGALPPGDYTVRAGAHSARFVVR